MSERLERLEVWLRGELRPPTAIELRRARIFALIVALIAVALRWPTTAIGPMSDDFMQWGMLAGLYPGDQAGSYAPFDLYAFLRPGQLDAYVEKGVAPWWAVPELYGTVFRPLASLLLWLDHRLAPGNALVWHIHSLAWYAAMLLAAAGVLRRLLPPSLAALALVLLACDSGVLSPLAWLANRCVLTCATFGFAAMIVHLDWRGLVGGVAPPSPAQRRRGPWIEALLMSLCMASGEYGLAIVLYLLVHELFTPASWPERARALLPSFVPLAVYLLLHTLGGYGTFGAEVYVDPFETPLAWAGWAISRVPELIASAFWSIPGATVHVFHHFALAWIYDAIPPESPPEVYHHVHIGLAWIAIALAAITLVLVRRGLHRHERRALRTLVIAGLIGLLPVSVAPAHERLLILAQLANSALLAGVGIGALRLATGRAIDPEVVAGRGRPSRFARWLPLPLASAAIGLGIPGDLVWGHYYIRHLHGLQVSNVAAFTEGDVLDQPLEGRDVLLMNCVSQSVGLYGEFMIDAYGGKVPRSWRPLAMGQFAMFAARPADDVLELSAIQGAWLRTPGELFFRREDQHLHAGDVLEHPGMRVEILADDEGDPVRVRFTFPASLDDPRYLFVISTREGLRRWPVPKVGQRGVVPIPQLPSLTDASTLRIPNPRLRRD
ncbi:hypothetical protein ACNOYE_32295 [Nannocystaceae bacterium ST9]